MAFNPDTHFKVRNLTRDPLTLKAADGSFVMIGPGGGDIPVEHKFNWDMPPKHIVSTTPYPHPERSVMTADAPKLTTHHGNSTGIGMPLAPPAITIAQRVQRTIERMNLNRRLGTTPKISNKTGTTYVGKAGTPAAKAVSKALGQRIGAKTYPKAPSPATTPLPATPATTQAWHQQAPVHNQVATPGAKTS